MRRNIRVIVLPSIDDLDVAGEVFSKVIIYAYRLSLHLESITFFTNTLKSEDIRRRRYLYYSQDCPNSAYDAVTLDARLPSEHPVVFENRTGVPFIAIRHFFRAQRWIGRENMQAMLSSYANAIIDIEENAYFEGFSTTSRFALMSEFYNIFEGSEALKTCLSPFREVGNASVAVVASGTSIQGRNVRWDLLSQAKFRIAINSALGNEYIVDRLKPNIFVGADSYLFSCSSYADSIYRALDSFFSQSSLNFMVTAMEAAPYARVAALRAGGSTSQVVGLPISSDRRVCTEDININFLADGIASNTHNIGTGIGLPLAATLGDLILAAGFDGVAPGTNEYGAVAEGNRAYVKSHPDRSEIEKVHGVRTIPGEDVHKRFDPRPESYFDLIGMGIANLVSDIEKSGKKIVSMTPSYYDPLQKRLFNQDAIRNNTNHSTLE